MIKHIYGNAGLQIRYAQDPSVRSQPNFQETQKRYRGNFLYRWHVCYYHECGTQLMDRFGHMKYYDWVSIFSHLETFKSRKMEGSEAILLCWRTMWFWSDSQSSPASLKKQSSEINSGVRGQGQALESKTIYDKEVLQMQRAQDSTIRVRWGPKTN